MKVACSDCPLRKRKLFIPFTAEELAYMERFKKGEMVVDPGTTILMEGASSPTVFTVLSGQGIRYKTLENGRRQVINFLFAGDFTGLQAGLMGEMKHSVEAISPMVLCVFKRDELWDMFRQQPGRAYDLTWIAAVEEHFLGEAIATLGQRDAAQRIAWALLRMFQRLVAVGAESDGRVPLPFRQNDLADALGLSLVHTNKTLAKLRASGLADWSGGWLRVPDISALADQAVHDVEAMEPRPLM